MPTSIDNEIGQEIRKEILQVAPLDQEKTELLKQFYSELNFDSNTKVYVVKANVFSGKEVTYQAWYGIPEGKLFGNKDSLLNHFYNNYPLPANIKTTIKKENLIDSSLALALKNKKIPSKL